MRILILGEDPCGEAGPNGRASADGDRVTRIIRDDLRFPAHLWDAASQVNIVTASADRQSTAEELKALAEQTLRSEHVHLFSGVVCFGKFAGEAAARFFSTTLDAFTWVPTRVGDHIILGLPHPSHLRFYRRDDPWFAKARSALSTFETMLDPLDKAA